MKCSHRAGFAFLLMLGIAGASGIAGSSGVVWAEDAKKQEIPEIVAEINAEKITREKLASELKRQVRDLDVFTDSQVGFLQRQLLQRMVERILLLQAAAKESLVPTEGEVQEFVEKMKKGTSTEDFKKELQKYGINEKDFAAGLKEDMAIRSYLDKNVFVGLEVGDDEIQKAYSADPTQFSAPEEIHAHHILLKVPVDADPEHVQAVKSRAEQILQEVHQKKSDFAQLARQYSEAENRGDLPFFSRNQMEKPFSDAAFALKAGEISDLVRTRFGFHIIKVLERRGGETVRLPEVREKIKAKLLREKREKLLADHLEKLKKSNKVVIYYH